MKSTKPAIAKLRSSQNPKAPRPTKPLPSSDTPDIGVKARAHAIKLIEAALSRRNGWDEAVSASDFLGLEEAERSFARALALMTLRHLGQIDFALSKRLVKAPPAGVTALLRMGVAQVFFMGVADFAAVSTTMKLAERDGATRPYKGLINATLRGLIRDGGLGRDSEAHLLPDWLTARWTQAYGAQAVTAMGQVLASEPGTDLSFKTQVARNVALDAMEATPIGSHGAMTAKRGDVRNWPEFGTGSWWVQDGAAAAAVALLGPDLRGQMALDVCAAPGGKSLQLASRGAEVVAIDRSKARLKRLSENFKRAEMTCESVVADGLEWEDGRQFDIVLLDAPCSATGTYRRQPEVLWAVRPSDIAALADVQHRLLDAMAPRVKPGGLLIYCVCSLEREEGESQAIAFLNRHKDFHTQKLDPEAIVALSGCDTASLTPEGWLRALPHQRSGGQDGFFVAHMCRNT